jgi:hypothetical protein
MITLARITGGFWIYCIVAGIYGLFPGRGTHLGHDAVITALAAYLVVSVLLYALLLPVNPNLALLAAVFGIVGVATSGDVSFYTGIQCVLIGYLIIRSTYIPRTIGALMVIAGLGQIVALSTLLPSPHPSLLDRIGFITDGAGEIAFALWLLIIGVNAVEWSKISERAAVPAS